MRITFEKVQWKNLLSYGNETQTYEFKNGIDLISAKNGNGKCLRKNTKIKINIEDIEMQKIVKDYLKEKMEFDITLEDIYELYKNNPELKGNIKVQTRTGYYPIIEADITKYNSEIIKVQTKDEFIEGSPEHKVIKDNEWIFLKDLKDGDKILTSGGYKEVSVQKLDFKEDLYDIEVKDVHEYYSNNIVSHNSTIIESTFYALFGNPFRKIKKGSLINDINKKNLLVTLFFNIDGKGYKVKRGQKPNIFVIYEKVETEDGESEYSEIPEKATVKEYQDNFEEDILKIDETVFRQLISISSNMASSKPFMELTQREKEKLFQVVTDTSIFAHLSDKIKLRLQDAKLDLKEAEYKRDIIDNSIQSEQIMIEQTKKQNDNFEKYHQDNIDKTKESIQLFKDNVKKYEEGIEKLKVLKEEYNSIEIDLTSKKQELMAIEMEMRTYNEEQSDKIEEKYKKLIKNIDDNYYNATYTVEENEIDILQEELLSADSKIKELTVLIKQIDAAKKGSIQCKSCDTVNYLTDITEEEVQKLELYLKEKFNLNNRVIELKTIIQEKKDELESIKDQKRIEHKENKEKLEKEKKKEVLALRENQDDYKKGERAVLTNEIGILSHKMEIIKEKLLKSKHIKNTLREHQDNLSYYENKLVELGSVKLVEIDETSLNEKLKQQKEHNETQQFLTKNIHDLNYLMGMLSDKGENNLKGQIIARTVPFLNKGINYFLEKFSLNEFNFIVDEQFKERIISRENNTEYNSLSNGQKMRISFSIMFSFLRLIEEKNGVSTNMLFLDEILDGSLDSFGREELLQILKDEFSPKKNIIIISHNQEIKEKVELFDRMVKVKKEKFSSLEMD